MNVSEFGHRVTGLIFRPVDYVDRIQATGGSATRIDADWNAISRWSVLRSGALDGAEALIHRIENGEMVLARRATVSRHVSNKPRSLCGTGKMVDVSSAPELELQLYSYYRKYAPNHVWVGADGRVSAAAATTVTLSAFDNGKGNSGGNLVTSAVTDRPAGSGEDHGLGAPSGVSAAVTGVDSNMLTVSWTRAADEAGIVGYEVFMNDEGPDADEGGWIELVDDGGAPVLAGDLVTLRKRIDDAPVIEALVAAYKGDVTSDTEPWRMQGAPGLGLRRAWLGDPGVPDHTLIPGTGGCKAEWAMRVTLGPGESYDYPVGRFGPVSDTYYRTLYPGQVFDVRVHMRASGGSVQYRLTEHSADAAPLIPVPVGVDWPAEDVTFTTAIGAAEARPTGGVANGYLRLTAPAGSAAVFEIGYLHVSESGKPFGALDPVVSGRVGTSCGHVRAHNYIKTKASGIRLTSRSCDPPRRRPN